jgi:endonuclease-3 related protein
MPEVDPLAHRTRRQEDQVRSAYRALFKAWGPQHWWPARTRFEVIVGAYLTQNTAWTNVELALANLREAKILSASGIRRVPLPELEQMIRPSGYFRQKAARLKRFVGFLDRKHRGSLTRMFAQTTSKLREELLSLNGIGPETADSVLLYAGNHPVFVVDAYTRRILGRHGILPHDADYEDIRQLFERALPPIVDQVEDVMPPKPKLEAGIRGAHEPSPMSTSRRTALTQIYSEMHGLMVGVGKEFCRKSVAMCDACPLQSVLPISNLSAHARRPLSGT